MEKKTFGKKSSGYFKLVLSIVFLISGVFFGYKQYNENKKYDLRVNAVVKNVRDKYDKKNNTRKYKAECEYVVDGKKYSYDTMWSDHRYLKNDTITIMVNSENPEKINKLEFWTISVIFLFSSIMSFYFYKH